MDTHAQSVESGAHDCMSDEEIAQQLSEDEGKPVSVVEVRRLLFQGMRKLRSALIRRGLTCDNLLNDEAIRW